jgi:N-succinyldiaminopimelate aminotransferase
VNSRLDLLQPYPFERLRLLFAGSEPAPQYREIRLSIGEPRHETPAFIGEALTASLATPSSGLANYPTTQGSLALRRAIAAWIARRYAGVAVDPECEVLPVNGSREALFAFAQALLGDARPGDLVACPNPFYQIYEGAALLAGARPVFLNTVADRGFGLDPDSLPPAEWARVRLLYLCSPGNPTGKVLSLAEWREIFALADRYGFVIASDECYSEIYFDEARPPLGALEAAARLGRGLDGLVVFSSLSKRSNVPGLRSGFVAGDRHLLEQFLRYRTYHGCAMGGPVQAASIAAWQDEAHVRDNRRLYAEKFAALAAPLAGALAAPMPEAGFYFWAATPIDDCDFARRLYAQYNVVVLPGSYLAREAHGTNPGKDHVRIALVAPLAECREAIGRIIAFANSL